MTCSQFHRLKFRFLLVLFLSPCFLYSTFSTAEDYLLSAGDKISIHVYGEEELSFSELSIPKNGTISFPFIGAIRAVGISQQNLANIIAFKLKDGYLLDPQVTVSVAEYRPIFVAGAVSQPGRQPFFVNMDVERIIAVAGGFVENADRDSIIILREVDGVSELISASMNMKLLPGDVVTVTKIPKDQLIAEQVIRKQYVYLYGEVSRPGRYEYSEDLSVEKAIVLAGGFNTRASKRKISVSRGTPAIITKKVPLDYQVLSGDVITIGASLF
jgi:protein involved in polysaccharide export with SLBB domain